MRVTRIIGHHLVPLPHGIDSHGLLALATEMLTVAAARKRIPEAIAAALARLRPARDRLRAAVSGQLDSTPTSVRRVGGEAGESSGNLDAAWAALHHYLLASARIVSAETEPAKALLGLLFPAQLDFTKLPFKQKWSQSESRVERLREGAILEHVTAAGATRFAHAVADAHTRFGAAVGITAIKPHTPAPAERIKERYDALADAVRYYAFKTAAYAADDRPRTASLVDALLAPLSTWESRNKPAPSPVGDPPATADADALDSGDSQSKAA